MGRIRPLGLMVILAVAAIGAGRTTAQVPPPPPPPPPQPVFRDPTAMPQRDPTGQNIRRIPIGTATISGTVTLGDSGQPVRGARVSLSGSTRPPDPSATAVTVPVTPTRGGGPAQISMGVSMGGLSLSRSVLTDAQGNFTFGKLPAGQFTLSASRNQLLPATYGQLRPNGQGTAIQLTDGQQMRANLRLARGGVVTGMVVGPDGDPQPYAQIRALRYVMSNGIKRLQQMGGSSTDDRGMYRMSGLQPGDYIIGAMPNTGEFMSERMMADAAAVEQAIMSGNVQPPTAPGQPPTVTVQVSPPQSGPIEGPPGFLTTYYPGTLAVAQATAITVAANEERAGVDIQVIPVQSATIQGTVITPLAPGLAVQLSLLSDDPMSASMSPMSSRVGQEGKFTFRNVSPGRYTVMAQTVAAPPSSVTIINGVPSPPQPVQPVRLEDSQRLWGRADVSIDGPTPASVSISLQPGKSISGTVSFDMQRPPDLERARLTVTLATAPSIQQFTNFGALPQGQVGADGRFTITGVIPGRYILRAGGGIMKSSIVGGQDTLDFPLEFTGERDITDAVLTVTDRSSELSGVLTDVAGKPAVDFAIVVAPVDPRFWLPGARRVMMTRPDTAGRYAFRSLPPGDYMIAAVTDLDPGGQFDPEFLKAVAGGSVRVSISEGARVAQDLRVGR
jgi:hypothetical protein